MKFNELVASYIRDQWLNFRRALITPQAREELLSGALLSFYVPGTFKPVNAYMDSDFTIPHANTVAANSHGEFPPIWLDQAKPTALKLCDSGGVLILSAEDALAFCDNRPD